MNNSLLKGNVSHNNVLDIRQCGQCIRCPQKTTYKIVEIKFFIPDVLLTKMVNISTQDIGVEKKLLKLFDVLLTNIGRFDSSKFLHLTFLDA